MHNRVNPDILYSKVYNLSCNQVGHNLIGRVQSLGNQKLQLLFASTYYVTVELLHALA